MALKGKIALVILFLIGLSLAYHYRAVGGFRDYAIFLVFVGVCWWAVNHDWRKKDGAS